MIQTIRGTKSRPFCATPTLRTHPAADANYAQLCQTHPFPIHPSPTFLMAPFPPDRMSSSYDTIPHRPPSEETGSVYRCDHPGCGKGFTRKVSGNDDNDDDDDGSWLAAWHSCSCLRLSYDRAHADPQDHLLRHAANRKSPNGGGLKDEVQG